VFLDRDWFTLETASTLIANHSGLLHARVEAPAAAAEPTEPAADQQQKGKQKPTKQQRHRGDQSPPPPPPAPLSPLESAAAALSGTALPM